MKAGWGPGAWVRVTRRGYWQSALLAGNGCDPREHWPGERWGHWTQRVKGRLKTQRRAQCWAALGDPGWPEGSAEPWGQNDGRLDPEGGVTGTGGGRGPAGTAGRGGEGASGPLVRA